MPEAVSSEESGSGTQPQASQERERRREKRQKEMEMETEMDAEMDPGMEVKKEMETGDRGENSGHAFPPRSVKRAFSA